MLYQAKTKAKVEVVGTGKGCAAAKATAVAGGCALACSQHACRSCTHSPAHTPPVLTSPAQRMVRLHSHVSCMRSSCVVAPLTLLTLPACSPLLPLLLQFPYASTVAVATDGCEAFAAADGEASSTKSAVVTAIAEASAAACSTGGVAEATADAVAKAVVRWVCCLAC